MQQGSILNRVVAAWRFGVDGSNPKPKTYTGWLIFDPL